MKNMSIFQMIVLMIFAILAMVGVFFLSTFRAAPNDNVVQIGSISIWGTYDGRVMSQFISDMSAQNESFRGVRYTEFSPEDFNQELLEALAEDRSPDLLLLNTSQVYENRNRILPLESSVLTRKQYRDTYLEIAERYFWNDAILGLPLLVDPMVMYWNRSIFSSAGLVSPPTFWSELFVLAETLTERDENLNISDTAVALGEMRNVTNSKEIIATLGLQNGNPITVENGGGELQSALEGTSISPSIYQSLLFFTDFSNPSKTNYSWNRSLPESETYFLGGNVAMHFGFASDIRPLQLKNPNLNFDVTYIPQLEGADEKSVYAEMYGLFIPRGAVNPNRSYLAMNLLTSSQPSSVFAKMTKLTSPRRDFVPNQTDDFTQIFRDQAVYADTFIDPDYGGTYTIMQRMVENITSGRRSIDQAIDLADAEINALIEEL